MSRNTLASSNNNNGYGTMSGQLQQPLIQRNETEVAESPVVEVFKAESLYDNRRKEELLDLTAIILSFMPKESILETRLVSKHINLALSLLEKQPECYDIKTALFGEIFDKIASLEGSIKTKRDEFYNLISKCGKTILFALLVIAAISSVFLLPAPEKKPPEKGEDIQTTVAVIILILNIYLCTVLYYNKYSGEFGRKADFLSLCEKMSQISSDKKRLNKLERTVSLSKNSLFNSIEETEAPDEKIATTAITIHEKH